MTLVQFPNEAAGEFRDIAYKGLAFLGFTEGEVAVHVVVEGLFEKLLSLVGTTVEAETINTLGILYGQCLVWGCKWLWCGLDNDGAVEMTLVTPDKSYCIAPLAVAWSNFRGERTTLLLQYRMIDSGNLPPSSPGKLLRLE